MTDQAATQGQESHPACGVGHVGGRLKRKARSGLGVLADNRGGRIRLIIALGGKRSFG